jgi:hypothetical protein
MSADLGLVGAGEFEGKTHVLGDGHVRVERVILEDHRDVAFLGFSVGDVASADQNAAAIDVLQSSKHAQ